MLFLPKKISGKKEKQWSVCQQGLHLPVLLQNKENLLQPFILDAAMMLAQMLKIKLVQTSGKKSQKAATNISNQPNHAMMVQGASDLNTVYMNMYACKNIHVCVNS